MNRRFFLGALAGLAAAPAGKSCTLATFESSEARKWIAGCSGPMLVLEANIAQRIPQFLIVTERGFELPFRPERREMVERGARMPAPGSIFELRSYNDAAPEARILRRAGIIPIFSSPRTHLMAFDSLAARERAWAAFEADPEWRRARARMRVNEISIYS